MRLLERLQARLELRRLEDKYVRRVNRNTFTSDAQYIDGEYVYTSSNSRSNSPSSRSSSSHDSSKSKPASQSKSSTTSRWSKHGWQFKGAVASVGNCER